MLQVARLAGLDLSQVIPFPVSSSIASDLADLDARLDHLECGSRRNGWVVTDGDPSIVTDQPWRVLLDRTLSYPAAADDSLELAVDVWQRDATTLVVNATVDAYCFCPVNHNVDRPAEREWVVGSGVELRDAMAAAVTALESWAELDLDADQWRARAGLPARPPAL